MLERVSVEAEADRIRRLVAIHGSPLLILDYGCTTFVVPSYPVDYLDLFGERSPSLLAGPTCDSIDVIDDAIMLPQLECGALIIGRMMGAYTWANATEFNFFRKAQIVAINEQVGEECAVVPLAG